MTQTLNDGAPVVIAQNEYDELGRLTRRQRADNDRLASSSSIATPSSSYPANQPGLVLSTPYNI
ncbi:MAG: hypothetical protein J6I60_05140 [Bacteroidaceae bacterium]|nr:hypothetical protein [Bacteroidaceae bacterium]